MKKITINTFELTEKSPTLNKMKYVSVLIALEGEKEFCEGVFCEDGFSWGYDETPIKDKIDCWAYLPKIGE